MTNQLRATGLSEEQRDALAKELEARGIGGWESAGEPRETIGEGDDAELGPQKYGFTIPMEGQVDIAALGTWLDQQRIAHVIEPRPTSPYEQPAIDEDEEPAEEAGDDTKAPAEADDDTKEKQA